MYDVIVVGAGAAGLQAAYSAQQAGLNTIVVEARDRIGGKVWSVPLANGRGVADLGAAWINDKKQPRITRWVKQFGFKTVVQRLTGTAVMQLDQEKRLEFPFGITPDFTDEEKKNLEYIRDHVQAQSLKPGPALVEDDHVTLDQYVTRLGANEKTRKMVNLWCLAMHGWESTKQSAAWFIDYCRRNTGLIAIRSDDDTGGNYMRIVGGTQQIFEGIAQKIGASNIYLSNPVSGIEDHGSHVTVHTTTGKRFDARKVIVSVPSTMYKELNISPRLPPPVETVTNGSSLGNYNKVIVVYDTPWWRNRGFNGFFMSFAGTATAPIALGRDTSVDEVRYYALTLFVQGEPAVVWSQKPAHERRAIIVKQLAAVYNADQDSECYKPIDYFEQIWKNEQYSRGALVPVLEVGHLTSYAAAYGKPAGNLHFAGTEYANHWKGYMEGALDSGEMSAEQVVQALKEAQKGETPRAKL